MNVLTRDKQIEIIAALTEGLGIRATARLTGVNRETVGTLALRVGRGCFELHDRMMVGVRTNRLELDEIWSYCFCKNQNIKAENHGKGHGDQWVWISMDADSKLAINWLTGNRGGACANQARWQWQGAAVARS